MKREKNEEMLKKAKNICEEKGYNLAGIILQGSQNYNLDVYDERYQSDYDYKAFVFPTFEDLYHNKKISRTIQTNFGQIEIKDVREFVYLLRKANPTYIELLYSISFDGQVNDLRKYRHQVLDEVSGHFFNALVGSFNQKINEIFKKRPGNDKMFCQFGYDNKSYSHAMRYYLMLEKFSAMATGSEPKEYKDLFQLKGDERAIILQMKVLPVKKEKVESVIEELKRRVQNIIDKDRHLIPKNNHEDQPALNKIKEIIYYQTCANQ